MKAHTGLFVVLASFLTLFIFIAESYSYTIEADTGSGGIITPIGSVTVAPGGDQAFSITPDPGYDIFDLFVDTGFVGPLPSYTFANVTADHSITASFYACDPPPPGTVKVPDDDSYYNSIMAAYDHAVIDLSLNNFTLQIAGTWFDEDLIFDYANVSVLLDGGYDCFFLNKYLKTRIRGTLTVAAGTVTPSDILMSAPPPCEPGDPNNFPGNTETCDGLDQNCNGIVDDGLGIDADGDGHYTFDSCDTFTPRDDCDDSDPNNYPGNTEICDGLDNNCNDEVDEGLPGIDNDGDGYTSPASCGGSADDCNDNNPDINPGAVEIYGDGIDWDCDGIDLASAADAPCYDCHSLDHIWLYNKHANSAPPDGTCGACHTTIVNNILPGHYGRTVRTASPVAENNMTAGSTIGCTSCHDWHDPAEYDIGGAEIIWPRVQAVGIGNETCDTCHLSRAAAHATDTAHNNRLIVNMCSECHTSDTTILGAPGSGTLTSDADVDTLHRSDCTLCHAYAGVKIDPATVEQAIQDGLNGIEVDCLSCHIGEFETIHAFAGNHTALINVGTTSCGNCHNDPPPLVDIADPKVHSSCSNCHDESYNTISLAAGKTFAAGGDCTTCHTDPFDTIHPSDIDHSSIVNTSGTQCGSCHTSTLLVDPADPKVHDSCSSCHDDNGGLINLAGNKTAPGNCTTCHGVEFITIHPDTVDHTALVTVGTTSCGNCHADQPPLVDPVDPKVHNECATCHDHNGGLISLAAGQSFASGGDCATCHTDPFATVHPPTADHSLAIQLSAECEGCHSVPPPLVDPADSKVHDSCSTCHDADGSLINLASGNTAPNECSTCHGTDLAALHSSVSAAIHEAAPGSDNVLIFAAGMHDSAMVGNGEVYINCQTCHNNQLLLVHDNNCSTCHPSPYDTLGTWTGGCQEGGCHTTYHADVTVSHWTVEDQCLQCHQDTDWTVPPTACANCHAVFNPADTIPPVTTSDAQAVYVNPALINFSIKENGGKVGVGTTYSRLNGGPLHIGSSILVGSGGSHTLEFWSVDQAGNVESPTNTVNFTITLDTTPPVTTSNAETTYYTPANITLTATDNNTYEITTYYSLDGGPTQTGTNVYIPELNGTFSYSLEFWSVDWSGNEEVHQTVNFTIIGGNGTIRLVFGNSDINGSPCPSYPTNARWTVTRDNFGGPIVATGSGACPDWSGVDDIVLDVIPASYFVEIEWWDINAGFYEYFDDSISLTSHGQVIRVPYP